MKKTLCAIAVVAAFSSSNVLAHEKGDFFVRAGVASVIPNDSSDGILGTSSQLAVNSDTQLGLNLDYMMSDNVGIELLAATPFSHEISTDLGGLGNIGKTKHLPPTLMAEYYFGDSQSAWRPYIGAGVNYTTFFDSSFNSTGTNAGLSDLSLDDSWGLAANIGVDYKLNENWFLNASIWYANIETTAHYKAGTESKSTDVKINPVVVMLSGGYKF
ncbi:MULTISPECIES: outer membrane protein OmpW [unclassified Agarivorans]|uniref:outer membrane protein OmpW n=1 Tax=unclassified Agarivorans TaxID=2636026 RepID=UPI003D7ED177